MTLQEGVLFVALYVLMLAIIIKAIIWAVERWKL